METCNKNKQLEEYLIDNNAALPKPNALRCMFFDCGWCYHRTVSQPHPCPGIRNCDVKIDD